MLNRFYSLFSVILLTAIGFTQFNPTVSYELSNPLEDQSSDLTFTISQAQGETDMAEFTISSSSGSFDFSGLSQGDVIGSGSGTFDQGATEVSLSLTVSSMPDANTLNALATIIASNSEEYPVGQAAGLILSNVAGGISIYVMHPGDEGTTTQGYTSSLTINNFIVPDALTLEGSFTSELAENVTTSDEMDLNTFDPTISVELSNIENGQSGSGHGIGDFTFTVVQEPGEIDLVDIDMSGTGFFNINRNADATIGTSSFTSSSLNLQFNLHVSDPINPDPVQMDIVAKVTESDDLDNFPIGFSGAGITIKNIIFDGSFELQAISPTEPGGGTTTAGYTSSLTIDGLFDNWGFNPFSWSADLTSELGNTDNITGEIELVDCNGDLSGDAGYDECGVCSGGNTGLTPNDDLDCAGTCGGNAIEDCLGVCNGSAEDLGCGCGEAAPVEWCEDWDEDGFGGGTPVSSCGLESLPLDYVDNCDDEYPFGFVGIAFGAVDNTLESNGTLNIQYTSDVPIHAFSFEVSGVEIVSASTVVEGFTVNVDNNIISGTATQGDYSSNSGVLLTTLTYVYGPTSEATFTGVGSVTTLDDQSPNLAFGGGITLTPPPTDCAGTYNGSAIADCAGVCEGPAVNYGCGCDVLSVPYYYDVDGDGLGFGESDVSYCPDTQALGMAPNNDDTEPFCATNDTDDCGVCGGGNAGQDNNEDCCEPSQIDDCGLCYGTGATCNGPVATDQPEGTDESTATTFNLNAVDPNDDVFTAFNIITEPSHGGISETLGASVSITYTPTENYDGEDSFTYTVSDGTYTSNEATVTITIAAVNDFPVANDISRTTPEDNAVSFQLSGTDEETDNLTFNLTSDPSNGSVSADRAISGFYTYTPNDHYNGSDFFTYTVFDGENHSDNGTVSITITPENDPPEITGQNSVTMSEDGELTLTTGDVTFTDEETDTYSLSISGGSNYLVFEGVVHPHVNFNGSLYVPVQIFDGSAYSNTFSVQVTVIPVNDAPVAVNDNYTVYEDGVLVIDGSGGNGVLSNDTDMDSGNLSSTVLVGPSNGIVNLGLAGTFNYTPNANYVGSDSFTYTVSDDNDPAGTDVGTVNIIVNAVNDIPVVFSLQFDCLGTSPCPFDTQYYNEEIQQIIQQYLQSPLLGGTVNLNEVREGEEWLYTGDGSSPFDILLYGVNDGDTDSELARIDFINLPSTSRNFSRALTAYDSNSSLSEDAVSSISLVASDFDTDLTGATIAITYTGNGTVGTPVLDAEISDENVQIWNVDYTPEADFVGADSFTFTVNGAATATVDIILNNVNDAPILTIDDQNTNEGSEYTYTAVATDVDPSDVSTYTVLNGPAGLVIDANSGVLSGWTPGNDEVGDHVIEIQATDDGTDPGSLSTNTSYAVTVLNVNDVPVIDDQVVLTTVEETDLIINLTDLSVTDPDNLYPDDFTLSVSAGSNYTVLGATITPDTDFNGDLTVPVTVNDGTDDSASFDLTVTVTAVNDAPTLAAIADPTAVDEDGDDVSVSFTPMDVEAGDFLSVSVSVSNDALFPDGSFSVDIVDAFTGVARTVTLNPADNLSGSSVVIVEVTDGSLTAVQQFTATVNAVNDNPVLNAIGDLSFDEDTSLDYTVTASDIDNDQGDLQYSVLGGDESTISAEISGSVVTFTAAADYNGSESFTIAVADADFDFDSEIINVTVDPVNDAPVITSTAGTTARTSEEYTYQVTATDVDEDTYAYALSNEPDGMLVSEAGLVTWSPSAGTFTSGTVTLTVSDGGDASDSELFVIIVAQVDCAGVDDGDAELDECGICSGGTTDHEANSDQDCAGTCFGSALEDDCGVCAGGFVEPESLLTPNADQDCAGICFGEALVDDCDVCTGGTTPNTFNQDQDCNEDCFGTAVDDSCGECSGGNSGHIADSDIDCNGDCFGIAFLDDCDVCSEGDSGHTADSDDVGCGCFEDAAENYYSDIDEDGLGCPSESMNVCAADAPAGWTTDNSDSSCNGGVFFSFGDLDISGTEYATVQINYSSDVAINSVLFSVDGLSLIGGSTDIPNDSVIIDVDNNTATFFTPSGGLLQGGVGTLVTLEFAYDYTDGVDACINISDVLGALGSEPDFSTGDCLTVNQPPYDCFGIPNGGAVEDVCGVCAGSGTSPFWEDTDGDLLGAGVSEEYCAEDTPGDNVPPGWVDNNNDECPNDFDNDIDEDGFCGDVDNCPDVFNPQLGFDHLQLDGDNDTIGDACDNCVDDANTDQSNVDDDLWGDVCDNCADDVNDDQADADTDDVGDVCDNCVDDANTDQSNVDDDLWGDVCDNCVDDANDDQADFDVDTEGDVCDAAPDGQVTLEFGDVDGIAGTFDITYDTDIHNNTIDLAGFQFVATGVTLMDASTTNPDFTVTVNPANGQVVGVSFSGGLYDAGTGVLATVTFEVAEVRDITLSAGIVSGIVGHQSIETFADDVVSTGLCDTVDGDLDEWGDSCDPCPADEFNDADIDGFCADVDNCPDTFNDDQADMDTDLIGDVCDDDVDGDGALNVDDNCPEDSNSGQEDQDTDLIGDACDDDIDGDGFLNDSDNCPTDSNPDQADYDADGIGDVCDETGRGYVQIDFGVNTSDTDPNLGTVDIMYTSNVPITYFSFDVDGISLTGVGSSDLNLSVDGETGHVSGVAGILPFNEDGAILATLEYDFSGTFLDTEDPAEVITACFSAVIFSVTSRAVPDIIIGDCGDFTEPAADCAGTYNGELVDDACGVCDGPGVMEYCEDTDLDGLGFGGNANFCPDGTPGFDAPEGMVGNCSDECPNDFDNDIDGDTICGDVDNCVDDANTDQLDYDGDGEGDVCDACAGGETDLAFDNMDGFDGYFDITYNSDSPIFGFQLDLDGVELVNATSDWPDLIVSTNPDGGIVGFILGETGIPEGLGTLITVQFIVGMQRDVSFNTTLVSGPSNFENPDLQELCVFAGDDISTGLCSLGDADGDLWGDGCDNCVDDANDDQLDTDGDTQGDACDECPFDEFNDADDDGVCGDVDICEGGDDNVNADGDALPDFCDDCPLDADNDIDEDGVCGDVDNCPVDSNSNQENFDLDSEGDVCDATPDGEATIDFGLVDGIAGTFDIEYSSDVFIYGFQFVVADVTLIDASTTNPDFVVSVNPDNGAVIGFSLSGGSYAPGSGTMATVTFEVGMDREMCITDGLLAGSAGHAPELTTGDCVNTGLCDELDTDGDLWGDVCDNCSDVFNDDQANADDDMYGDVCDECPFDEFNDADDDGVCGDVDICEGGDDNVNADGDALPDFCDDCPLDADNDIDEDGVCGDVDNCPVDSNSNQENFDLDSEGDVCDATPDGEATIDFGLVDGIAGTFDIEYSSDVFIYGFQFVVADVTLIDASTTNPDFVVSVNPDNGAVIGFSLSGGSYAPGSGTMATVTFEVGMDREMCITDGLLAGSAGHAPELTTGDCVNTGLCDELDTDGDLWGDVCDNCSDVFNDDQANADDDMYGDVCDNCVDDANDDQLDSDGDLDGDVCDECPFDADNDIDGDGVCVPEDNCPLTYNPDQDDFDGDGEGDVCDDTLCGEIWVNFDSYDNDGMDYGVVEITYSSQVDIYNAFFSVSGIANDMIGGETDHEGFIVNTQAPGFVNMYSPFIEVFPATEDNAHLVRLFYDYGYEGDIGMSNVTIASGNPPVCIPLVHTGDPIEIVNPPQDCAGAWNGLSYIDDCGICDDNPLNDGEYCAPPTDVTAEGGRNDVALAWTANELATYYNIYRDGEMVTSLDGTEYVDGDAGFGLNWDTEYCYTINSVYTSDNLFDEDDGDYEGAASETVCATTLPFVLVGLSVEAMNDDGSPTSTVNVYMTNLWPVYGYQFDLGLDPEIADVIDIDGLLSASYGNGTVLGFDFGGASIDPGENQLLVSLTLGNYVAPSSEITINIIPGDFSDEAAMALNVCDMDFDNTNGCDISVTFDPPPADCMDVPGGTAATDACGVCYGGTSGIDEPNLCNGSTDEFDDACEDEFSGPDIDDCGVCFGGSYTDFDSDGFSDDCDDYPWGEVTVTYGDNDDTMVGDYGTFDVLYDSQVAIYGFQFNISGVTIESADTDNSGFTVSVNPVNGNVVGFSLGGDNYPSDIGTLCTITYRYDSGDVNSCITGSVFSALGSNPIQAWDGDCNEFVEPIIGCDDVHNSGKEFDDCGVCDGTSYTDFDGDEISDECDEYPWGELTLTYGDVDDTMVGDYGTFDVLYDSQVAVYGFQFNISDVTIESASTDNPDFTVSVNPANGNVVGFSLSGASYDSGAGTLCTITYRYDSGDVNTCQTGSVFSALGSLGIQVWDGDCIDVFEPPIDCFGVHNGDAVLDGCDVCGGDSFDDWDGDGTPDACDPTPDGEVTVAFGDVDGITGSFDITYDADVDLYAYQFVVSGVTLIGATTDNPDFAVSVNPANGGVVGFSVSGGNYPIGSGTLATITFVVGYDREISLSDVIVAGSVGGSSVHSPFVTTGDPTMTGNCDIVDNDGDLLYDACDECPLDPLNDIDEDGVCGDVDNCPDEDDFNPGQENGDGDEFGDVCDPCPGDILNDIDLDGVCGNEDNCPEVANTDQLNSDGDLLGDACDDCEFDADNDIDGDGVCGNIDNCPVVFNDDQSDYDGDGVPGGDDDDYTGGDVCDASVYGDIALEYVNEDYDNGTFDIMYTSNTDISGFFFAVTGIDVISFTSSVFTIIKNENEVTAYSPFGQTLPAGEGLLLSVVYEPVSEVTPACIINAQFYGLNNNPIYFGGYCEDIDEGTDPVVTIDIDLSTGWNWFSINVMPEDGDMSLDAVLATVLGSADFIKSQSSFASYVDGFGWFGTLTTITNTSFYMVHMLEDATLTFTGVLADPADTPIDLGAGWNWVGYIPDCSQAIDDALMTIEGDADFVKNQSSFASYVDGFGWFGTLSTMNPLEGYMMHLLADGTLTYPVCDEVAVSERDVFEPITELIRNDVDWSIDHHDYEFNGSITATVELDGFISGSENDYLAVFVGDEVRGINSGLFNPLTEQYEFPMMVFSNEEVDAISFRYYHDATNTLYGFETTSSFTANMMNNLLLSDGYDWNVGPVPTAYELGSAYPNPFNPVTSLDYSVVGNGAVNITVYDITGRIVEVLVDTDMSAGKYSITWNAGNMPSGLYLVRMEAGSYLGIQKLMLVK